MRTHVRKFSPVTFLSIDLEQEVGDSGWVYRVICERPGRQGSFSKEWIGAHGRLNARQVQDLSSWVALTCQNALAAWGGIQEELDV